MFKFSNFANLSKTISFHLWNKTYSTELLCTLQYPKWYRKIPKYSHLEKEMSQHFQYNLNLSENLGKETNSKQNFNYILIDPRISKDLFLKNKVKLKNEHELWKKFLKSIFYIGKGKEKRPLSHFNSANKIYQILKQEQRTADTEPARYTENFSEKSLENLLKSKKLLRIIDIWVSRNGVICLPVFHNTLPTEAYTREAAIIDALGLENLTNKKRGKYYGITKKWSSKKRKLLGITLLQKAMREFFGQTQNKFYPKKFSL